MRMPRQNAPSGSVETHVLHSCTRTQKYKQNMLSRRMAGRTNTFSVRRVSWCVVTGMIDATNAVAHADALEARVLLVE